MKCPRCAGSLRAENYEGTEIDRCQKCSGAWLDYGELKPILEKEELKFSDKMVAEVIAASGSAVPASERKSVEPCPKCGRGMDPMNFSFSSGIVIDVCADGHGIWFDRHELEKVQAFHENWAQEALAHRADWMKIADRSARETQEILDRNTAEARSKALGGTLVYGWLLRTSKKLGSRGA